MFDVSNNHQLGISSKNYAEYKSPKCLVNIRSYATDYHGDVNQIILGQPFFKEYYAVFDQTTN
jgi:hypothetical protein